MSDVTLNFYPKLNAIWAKSTQITLNEKTRRLQYFLKVLFNFSNIYDPSSRTMFSKLPREGNSHIITSWFLSLLKQKFTSSSKWLQYHVQVYELEVFHFISIAKTLHNTR